MKHVISSIGKAMLGIAVILPGADALGEYLSEVGDVTNTEGVGAAVRTVGGGIDTVADGVGGLAASVGNLVGIDYLAGVGPDGLSVQSFNDDFGIIPTMFSSAKDHVPEAVTTAFQGENAPTLLVGATAGVAGAAMIPGASDDVRDSTVATVRKAGEMGRGAANAVSTAGRYTEALGQHTSRVLGERSAPSTGHGRTT